MVACYFKVSLPMITSSLLPQKSRLQAASKLFPYVVKARSKAIIGSFRFDGNGILNKLTSSAVQNPPSPWYSEDDPFLRICGSTMC